MYTTPTRKGDDPLVALRVINGVTPSPGENSSGHLKRSFVGWTVDIWWRSFLPQPGPRTRPSPGRRPEARALLEGHVAGVGFADLPLLPDGNLNWILKQTRPYLSQ